MVVIITSMFLGLEISQGVLFNFGILVIFLQHDKSVCFSIIQPKGTSPGLHGDNCLV